MPICRVVTALAPSPPLGAECENQRVYNKEIWRNYWTSQKNADGYALPI